MTTRPNPLAATLIEHQKRMVRERLQADAKGKPLTRYQRDPVGFARDVLGMRLWRKQREILNALAAKRDALVAVRSGHKVGKSRLDAVAAFWFAACFPGARAIMTSASGRQVKDILWREISAIWRKMTVAQRELLGCHPPHVAPDAGVLWDDGREIKGFTTDDPERMAGYSGENLLFILDEASGIERPIFEAIEGNRAGGTGRVLMTSNPTRTTGEFFDAFHNKRAFYVTFCISSLDSPNVTGEEEPIPGIADPVWCEQMERKYGKTSPLYEIRVLGNFPSQGSNAVIGVAAIEEAKKRGEVMVEPQWSEARLHLGVDVARFGDDESVITARRGAWTAPPRVVLGFDTVEVAGLALKMARELVQPGEGRKPLVKVDGIGVGGGVVDILRRSDEIEVVEVNVAEVSDDQDEYPNLRSQLWFGLANWLDTGAIANDEALEGELAMPSYSFDARGRRVVIGKKEMKQKLGRSPDRAESLMLAVYGRQDDASAWAETDDDGGEQLTRYGAGRGY
jgi:phage terminase large subunit